MSTEPLRGWGHRRHDHVMTVEEAARLVGITAPTLRAAARAARQALEATE